MVSAISASNINTNIKAGAKASDVSTLIKYANNQTIKEVPDSFASNAKDAFIGSVAYDGIPLFNFFKRSRKVKNLATSSGTQLSIKDAMKAMDKKNLDALQNIFTGKESSLGQRVANYIKTANESKQSYINLKDAVKSASKVTKIASKKGATSDAIENAIKNAADSADYFVSPKDANVKVAQEALENATKALAENPKSKKLQKLVEKATKKLDKAKLIQSGAKSTSKLGKFAKFMKSSGAGVMLAFSGIIEFATEVLPTFKELGNEKGMKQLGKSTVKVVADTAGFIAGEQLGVAIGSAIGTAIFPGAGTAIGALCGAAFGLLGSSFAGKVTQKLVGKSEREIVNEQAIQQQAVKIVSDNNSLEELKNTVKAKIQEEASYGELSEDSKIALATLENLESTNPFMV